MKNYIQAQINNTRKHIFRIRTDYNYAVKNDLTFFKKDCQRALKFNKVKLKQLLTARRMYE